MAGPLRLKVIQKLGESQRPESLVCNRYKVLLVHLAIIKGWAVALGLPVSRSAHLMLTLIMIPWGRGPTSQHWVYATLSSVVDRHMVG